jgi:RNA polymerase sigma-70 factor (ECF subfamily)
MREDRETVNAALWIAQIAARQDRAAFAALFNFYAPRIKGLMMRTGCTPDVAEEIAQEALLAVWRKASYFDPSRANASAWIFTIARNLRTDRLRRQVLSVKYAQSEALDEESSSDPTDDLSAAQLNRRVANALTSLSDDQLRVVKLSFFEERPHNEIAQVLGIPLGTVKSRLRLAMSHLRKTLGDLT